jgi:transmembrane 9 superfamily protein 2/4
MSLDSLPLVTEYEISENVTQPVLGFDIGYVKNGKHYLRSSIHFRLGVQGDEIVIMLSKFGIAAAVSDAESECFLDFARPVAIEDAVPITFQLSVSCEEVHRDLRQYMDELDKTPAIPPPTPPPDRRAVRIAAIGIVLAPLTIAWVLYRTAWRKRPVSEFDEFDGCEWKLIQGDVGRPPEDALALSLRIGWGVQFLVAVCVMLVVGRSDSVWTTGRFIDKFIAGFVCGAPVGGFFTGSLFKMIGDGNWRTILMRIPALSILVWGTFWMLYGVVVRPETSTIQLPTHFFRSFVLNFLLDLVGAIAGIRARTLTLWQKVNKIPRQIPPQSYVASTVVPTLLSAVFVFATAAVHIHLVMVTALAGVPNTLNITAIFLGAVTFLFQSIVAGIVVTWWRLANEDFRWWWAAYRAPGAAALAFAVYCVYFLRAWCRPPDLASAALVFCIMAAGFIAVRFAGGAAGFLGAFGFVRVIYNTLKVE